MASLTREIRVHWGHCDPARIVFHPNYLVWIDEGLAELLEAAGVRFADVLRETPDFVGTPIVSTEARFRGPARYGEILTHEARVLEVRRRSFTVANRFSVGDRLVLEEAQARIWGRATQDAAGAETLEASEIPDWVGSKLAPMTTSA